MRYDGIGMGGAGGAITAIVIIALIGFLLLSMLHKRHPGLTESGIGGLVTIAIGGFWLFIYALVVVTISVPVSGALDLDRSGQLMSLPIIAFALYLVGKRLK